MWVFNMGSHLSVKIGPNFCLCGPRAVTAAEFEFSTVIWEQKGIHADLRVKWKIFYIDYAR